MSTDKKKIIIIVTIAIIFLALLCCCSIVTILTITNSSTSTTTLTPTPTRNINFTDTFEDNQYGWAVGTTTNEYATITRNIIDEKYLWSIDTKKDEPLVAIANPQIEKSQSLVVSIDAEQLSGTESTNYNLLLFYNDINNYYSLRVNQAYQMYSIGVYKDGQWTDWINWTRDALVNYDKSNNLRIESNDGTHVFYINDIQVLSKTDSSITSGGAAIAVQTYENEQQGTWAFDNFSFEKIK